VKITNRAGIHPALVLALENDAKWYSGTGEERFASVTDLIKPPNMVALERAHVDELEEEAIDCLWRLRGSALHRVIEELIKGDPRAECEKRMSIIVNGHKITGGYDLLWEGHELIDFKDTSVWHLVYSDMLPKEYVSQLNMYRFMEERPVDKLTVIPFLRDWSKHKAHNMDYPAAKCLSLDVPIWPREKTRAFLETRALMLEVALSMDPTKLPECWPEDRWEQPTKYAVKKKGRKSALRVLDSVEAAEAYIAGVKKPVGLSVETRPGARTRCEGYCRASRWCQGYQAYLNPEGPVKKDLFGCTVPPRKRRR
jgi:hypothetical protein